MTEQRIQCFWLEPSEIAEKTLRRYGRGDANCPGRWGYHNASVSLGQVPYSSQNSLNGEYRDAADKTDPRWPTHCSCGYQFQDEDNWQTGLTRLYRRAETGELFNLAEAPVGAMWDACWYRNIKGFNSSHPEMLMVRTPGGDWAVDGPSSNGGNWTRSGSVPNVTAKPSIMCGGYHGFLTSGFLVECG